jgi:RES domain-containing protein
MLLWRITRKAFLDQALAGLGARKYGGRWNSRGVAVVYTSESLELAVLEALVHLDIDLLPRDYYQVGFELDDTLVAAPSHDLPRGWDRQPPYPPEAQVIGDTWVRSGSSLALRVPASVLPSRSNILINPAHPEMPRLREVERKRLPWPDRLRHTGPYPTPRCRRIPFAASRPSNTAVTTKSDPRTISPPANTLGLVV